MWAVNKVMEPHGRPEGVVLSRQSLQILRDGGVPPRLSSGWESKAGSPDRPAFAVGSPRLLRDRDRLGRLVSRSHGELRDFVPRPNRAPMVPRAHRSIVRLMASSPGWDAARQSAGCGSREM